MTEPDAEADFVARQKTRRIVGRVALKKINALVSSWEEEEKAKKRFVWWILFGLGIFILLAGLLPFAFNSHPKARLFVMSLGAGVVLAAVMIIRSQRWAGRRRVEPPQQSGSHE